MTAKEILDKYISFFEKRGHTRIENSSLVPNNDPTTLFTSSGMQPLVPFLLGETHPQGNRLVNAQNCFRAQDIDEIGDNRHTTFFRMLGNWSLGEYFKEDQIEYFYKFLTDKNEGLGLDPKKLYVTVFAGEENFKVQKEENRVNLNPDVESADIWSRLFDADGVGGEIVINFNSPQDISMGRIFYYPSEKNWWSRSGTPDKMPVGEIGGPDTEVFYDFGAELKIHDKSIYRDANCHPNCDCGRFVEIGNSVFMQYKKTDNKSFEELPQKNVDFGGGLERLVAATENKQDVFETSLIKPIIQLIESQLLTKFQYGNDVRINRAFRIIADHLIAATFIVNAGIIPSNKEQGSVLRRLIRRAVSQKYLWGDKNKTFDSIIKMIMHTYSQTDTYLFNTMNHVIEIINDEEKKANTAMNEAFKVWAKWVEEHPASGAFGNALWGTVPFGGGGKMAPLSAEKMFYLYQSYGLSMDIIEEVTHGHIDKVGFKELLAKHKQVSRAGIEKKFKGGLADSAELTVKGHTATHLMHQALRDVLGNSVHQTGSNITELRVRFDFAFDRKVTEEELIQVTDIVLSKITEDLPVHFKIMPLKKARDLGAIGLFNDKYAEDVKIYFIGGGPETSSGRQNAYSVEFCGGPHVGKTSHIKSFAILKEEGVAKGVRRIYAKVG